MLHFSRISIENFGPYKGRQEIEFSNENGVTIVWGNNGLGKTTLLNVFRYALLGKVLGRGTKSHSLKQVSNWESYDEGNFGFKVTLKMVYHDIPYELTRQFLVKEGVEKPVSNNDYKEEVFLKKENTFLPPNERNHFINTIMPEKISRFFLFDGELLEEYEDLLINESDKGEKIKEAIESILGLPILTNGLSDITSAEKEFSKRLSKVAQKNKNTQVIGNLLEFKQKEFSNHEDELNSLKMALIEIDEEYEALEKELKKTEKAREWINEKTVLENLITSKKNIILEKKKEIKELTGIAWQGMLKQRIDDAIVLLEKEIELIETKKNKYLISHQLLEQIKDSASSGICPVCEQSLSEKIILQLKEKTEEKIGLNFLSKEESQKLIDLQGRRAQLHKFNVENQKPQIASFEREISNLTVEISDAERRVSEINKNLFQIGDIDLIVNISKDYAKCLEKKKNTETGIDNETKIKTEIELEIKNLESKLRQHDGAELQKSEKDRDFCENIKKIFEEGVDLYRNQLKERVEKDATDIFNRISNQNEYSALKINQNYGLAIMHKSGRIVEIRSAGYEHIVALSLIGALHKNAPMQGPIIMDSPFGRLDPKHKEKITGALEFLADQVILLVYSGEINEQHAREILGGSLKNEYYLKSITAFNTIIQKI